MARHLASKLHRRAVEALRGGPPVPPALPISFIAEERRLVLRSSPRLPWTYECLRHAVRDCPEAARCVASLSGADIEVALALTAVVQKYPRGRNRPTPAQIADLRRRNQAPAMPTAEERLLAHLTNREGMRAWAGMTKTLPGLAEHLGAAAPDALASFWRERVGRVDGPLYRVLAHLATAHNDVHATRAQRNLDIERAMRGRDAGFVCIGNDARNGETNLLARLRRGAGSVGRLDPVVLFVRRAARARARHPLYVLHDEHVRTPVGHLHYVPWRSCAAGAAEVAREAATGLLLWRGRRVGWVSIDRHAYNGQLRPGDYCQWVWDRDGASFVPAGGDTVRIGLERDDPLVQAALLRYPGAARAPATGGA
jgi:hypothetical protein